MRIVLRTLCFLLTLAIGTGCSATSEPKRPHVYRGGQYYGDAIHGRDLNKH